MLIRMFDLAPEELRAGVETCNGPSDEPSGGADLDLFNARAPRHAHQGADLRGTLLDAGQESGPGVTARTGSSTIGSESQCSPAAHTWNLSYAGPRAPGPTGVISCDRPA